VVQQDRAEPTPDMGVEGRNVNCSPSEAILKNCCRPRSHALT
jgi:hypothetical protein